VENNWKAASAREVPAQISRQLGFKMESTPVYLQTNECNDYSRLLGSADFSAFGWMAMIPAGVEICQFFKKKLLGTPV
jgi:hypothetical protein